MRTSPNGSFLHSRTLRSSEPHDSRMKVTRGTCVFSGAGALGTLPSDSHSFIFSPGCGALLPVHAMGYGLRAAAGPGSPPGFPDVPGSCTPAPAAPQHLAVPQTGLQFLASPVCLCSSSVLGGLPCAAGRGALTHLDAFLVSGPTKPAVSSAPVSPWADWCDRASQGPVCPFEMLSSGQPPGHGASQDRLSPLHAGGTEPMARWDRCWHEGACSA